MDVRSSGSVSIGIPVFDHVISLGQACDTTAQIRRHFGQAGSLPFDWLITPPTALIRLIEEDFAGILQCEHMDQEHHYVIDRSTGLMFLHDFKNLSKFKLELFDVQAKYTRRIERFRKCLESKKNILFVRSQQWNDQDVFDQPNSEIVLDTLRKKYPGIHASLLVVNPTQADIPEFMGNGLFVCQIDPPVPLWWEGDDLAWKIVFERVIHASQLSRQSQI